VKYHIGVIAAALVDIDFDLLQALIYVATPDVDDDCA
jgi:hypothetical protein